MLDGRKKKEAANSSEERVDLEHLTNKKEKLSEEVSKLKKEMKQADSDSGGLKAEYEKNLKKKEKLAEDLFKFLDTIDADEAEIESLGVYAEEINNLLRNKKLVKRR